MKDFIDKGNLAWLLAGIGIGIVVMRLTSGASGMSNYIGPVYKKGDKGREILDFQRSFNHMIGADPSVDGVPETGTFDRTTAERVSGVFSEFDSLKNRENCALNKCFVNDFNRLINMNT